MPLLYYIRHGQTDWNAERRVQGTRDIPLNPTGIGQATAAGAILRDVIKKAGRQPADFDYVSSPLTRARHTMHLLRAALGLPEDGYRLDHQLREIAYGEWEGMTFAEIEKHSPAHYALHCEDRWGIGAPAGESYAQVGERLAAWYGALQTDTIAVAHGGTMRALMSFLGHLDRQLVSDAPIAQGAVYVFDNNKLHQFT